MTQRRLSGILARRAFRVRLDWFLKHQIQKCVNVLWSIVSWASVGQLLVSRARYVLVPFVRDPVGRDLEDQALPSQ